MNKKDAAALVGVSVRMIENYAKQGKLSVRYVKGKTGDIADFDEGELKRLRAERESEHATRPAVTLDSPETHATEARSLAPLSHLSPSAPLQILQALSALAEGKKGQPRANVGEKIMLTLADAAALSSLSEHHLREAIRAGKLKGKIIGRGYKIKRDALDAYIKKL